MTTVRIEDFRQAGICPDAKDWFARYGLSWRDFVRNGIDADVLRTPEPDNPIVVRVIAMAEEREARDGRQ